nr:MAG TPA: hypothetical protein [Caudoviricetes sp.]DAV11153.1 MAG TPA: hypothetical protein [Caudoviricetes sp.]
MAELQNEGKEFCNSDAAAGYWTRKTTLTVFFHTIFPSEN